MELKNLILVRSIILLYLTLVMIENNLEESSFPRNFYFLTLWGAYITYTFFALSFIENISYYLY